MPTRRPTPPPPPAAPVRARGLVLLAALAVTVALPAPAWAKLGDGLKVGPGRLKLGVDADVRFDSNAGIGFGGGATTPVPAVVLRGRPAFALDLPGDTWTAMLSGGVDWNQYLALGSGANTSPLNFLGAGLAGSLAVAPKGVLGGDVSLGFTRSDRIAVATVTTGGLSNSGDLRGRLRYRPGGGESGSALEFGGWYGLGFDLLSPQASGLTRQPTGCTSATCDTNQLSGFSWLANRVGFDAKYRPFPKTGFTFDLDTGFRNYPYFTNNPVQNVDAVPLRAVVGFGTLLTTRFFFSVKAGYTGLFFSGANTGVLASGAEHNVSGQVEGGLRFVDAIEGRLGYLRTLEPVSGNYGSYVLNRGYFDFRGQFAKLLATAGISADFLGFGLRTGETELQRRNDFVLGANLGFEYQMVEWLRVVGGLRFVLRQSSDVSVNGNYNRFDANLGVSTLF